MVDFVNTGNFPSKQSWKTMLNSKIRDQAHQDIVSEITQEVDLSSTSATKYVLGYVQETSAHV